MNPYDTWCRHVDEFLETYGRNVRIADIDPNFLRAQHDQGTAPLQFAQLPAFPLVGPRAAFLAATQPPVAAPPTTPVAPSMACPHCRQTDQSRRVEGLLMMDSRTTTGTVGMVHSGGGVSVGGVAATSRSNWGKVLAAPYVMPNQAILMVLGIVLLTMGCICSGVATQVSQLWILALLVIAGGIGVIAAYSKDSKLRKEFIELQYPARYQAWQRLMYCERCAVVFDLHTQQACPIADAPRVFGSIIGGQRYR